MSALFYILQQSGRQELAPLVQQTLDSGEKLENREFIARLLGDLIADRPITARYSPGQTDVAFAIFGPPTSSAPSPLNLQVACKGLPMGANSRGALQRATAPPHPSDFVYSRLQRCMAWDIRNGNWREPELKLLPYAVHAGETALDIGANFGVYCYYLSRAVGAKGQVFGFEPIPFTFSVLSYVRRLLRLRNVRLFNYGCSNVAGLVTFTVPLQDSGGVSAGQAHIGTRNDDHAGKEKQVRWKATREIPATLIKLDEFLAGFQLGR